MKSFKDIIICVLLVVCICCSVVSALKTNVVQGEQGIQGIQGENGKNGIDGKNGLDGKDGINGKDGKDGINGKDGKDGINGKDGKDGLTPYIGSDGKWYIGTECTEVFATETIYSLVADVNWSTCNTGDIVAFTFRPYYVSSESRGYYVYDYQTDNQGAGWVIHTTSYTIGSKTYTPPYGNSDQLLYYSGDIFACIGKVVYKDSCHIDINIMEAIKTK